MKPSLIQELDPNSNKIDPETGLRWYDIQMFGVKGQGWADTQRPYARLSVWQLAQRSAGLCLHITGMPAASNVAFAIAAHGFGRARRRVPVCGYRRIG